MLRPGSKGLDLHHIHHSGSRQFLCLTPAWLPGQSLFPALIPTRFLSALFLPVLFLPEIINWQYKIRCQGQPAPHRTVKMVRKPFFQTVFQALRRRVHTALSVFKNRFRHKAFQVGKNDEIRLLPRRDDSPVVEMHSPGRSKCSQINCFLCRHPLRHRQPDNPVQVSFHQPVRHRVIGYQCNIFIELLPFYHFHDFLF